MRVNEIKRERTIEEVVRVEYIAEDGQVFYNEEECKKYEESALFAVSKQLKKLHTKSLSVYSLLAEGCEDDEVEIFDIQTDKDLENLKRYLYLKAKKNGATEDGIKTCFTAENEKRKDYVFDAVTKGHEVIICWSYDRDHFWVHRDGSIEGYLNYLRDRMTKLITPETKENE